ncbi:kinase-like domain-containing protein [Hyaloraphidium curvatum]|nr:kinase-like domain-containing protein [Hyaloraphidium curvatum]
MGIAEVDLETVRSLGYGNSGVVTLVRHKPSGMLMARKVVALDLNRPRSLRHMHRAMLILSLNASPYLIGFFGCFISQQPDTTLSFAEASICLEFMDLGNVEELMPALRRADGTVEEGFVREVVKAVVGAMEYLYEGFRAVHRDIKPANVLLNSKGQVKLADLGELGTLGDEGYAQSFVGTGVYMSPERINPPAPGQGYSVQADVWSLGVMAVELISGKHPLGSVVSLGTDFSSSTASLLAGTSADFLPAVEPRPPPPPPKLTVDRVPEPPSVFDLLDAIVNGPAPSIPDSHEASPDLRLFLSRCLDKDPSKRAKPAELARHPWLEGAEAKVEGEVLERLIEYRKSKR